jgi:hypothetical protein
LDRGGSAIEEDEMRRVTRILALGGSVSVLLGVTLAFCTAGTLDVVHVMFPPSW